VPTANAPRWNFADYTYGFFFVAGTVLLLFRRSHVPSWPALLITNLLALALIFLLVGNAPRSSTWNFLHDWYPLAMPIATFEEVSRLSLMFRHTWQDQYLLALEGHVFTTPPTVWVGQHGSPWITELVELGYFSYFVLLMIVAGTFYARKMLRSFREVMDASVLSYMMCYVVFLLFPTEGPAHTLIAQHNFPLPGGGPFHWAVLLIQKHAGVHGNAFPSAHVAGGVVAVIFAWRYARKLGIALTPLVLLLCVGAVYDRYHYVSDVLAGAIIGFAASAIILLQNCRGCPNPEPRSGPGAKSGGFSC
jgi:membrane-associated phospholipid phosphatase